MSVLERAWIGFLHSRPCSHLQPSSPALHACRLAALTYTYALQTVRPRSHWEDTHLRLHLNRARLHLACSHDRTSFALDKRSQQRSHGAERTSLDEAKSWATDLLQQRRRKHQYT
jgi:hypothetical protein